MKKDLTELVFILDRSGSMRGLEGETIYGYNTLLEKQKKEPGDAIVTTVLFDTEYELLHDRMNIQDIGPITDKEYNVKGFTALLDAAGKTINSIGNALENTDDAERPENVMFVIITDGMENASREFDYEQVHKMIEHQKSKYNWEFIFLGANMDAVATAGRFGIGKDRAVNYHPDSVGTSLNYDVISETVSSFRSNHSISENWKEQLEDDFGMRDAQK